MFPHSSHAIPTLPDLPDHLFARGALIAAVWFSVVTAAGLASRMEKTPPESGKVPSIPSLTEADVRDSFAARWDALYDERRSTWASSPAVYVQTASAASQMAKRGIPKDEERHAVAPVAQTAQTDQTVPASLNSGVLNSPQEPSAPVRKIRNADRADRAESRPRTAGVCERHNMRQVWYGRSWRCQR